MAKAMGLSLRSVQRIWQAHQSQSYRLRAFKRSPDPAFAAKLADIVDLYIGPRYMPRCSRSTNESKIQALDRAQPGPPIRPGRCQTMTASATPSTATSGPRSRSAVLDNCATDKHPRVRAWLSRDPRWTFLFIPTSAS
jgi:hypothetical protein